MITITIKTDNAVFQSGNREDEVSRILIELGEQLKTQRFFSKVYDINGNVVGAIKLTGKDRPS